MHMYKRMGNTHVDFKHSLIISKETRDEMNPEDIKRLHFENLMTIRIPESGFLDKLRFTWKTILYIWSK